MIDDGQQLDLEATPFRASRSRRRTAAWVLLICGGLPALTTFMGFLGLFWWPCDILANFRFQYALILSGVIIAAMFSKRYLWAVLLCLPLALNVALIVPLFITSQSQQEAQNLYLANIQEVTTEEYTNDYERPTASIIHQDETSKYMLDEMLWHVDGQPLTIINLNMNVAERGSEHLIQLINSGEADIILAQSITESTLSQLSMHGTPYRIHNSLPRDDGYGVALLSRVSLPPKIRIKNTRTVDLANNTSSPPAIVATIQWFDRTVELMMVHLVSPWTAAGAKSHHAQIQGIVQWGNEQQHPIIVMGNFNTTTWSANFTDILRKTGLVNSQIGYGIQPTWPASGGFPLGEIAVDNCLHSDSLVTVERFLGPTNGADHRPLVVKLAWTKPSPIPDEAKLVVREKIEPKKHIDKAKAQAKAKAIAKAKAKKAKEKKARIEAKQKAEAKAKAEAKRKAQAEAKAKIEADAKLKAELEAKAKAQAETKLKAEVAAKAKAQAEAKQKAEVAAKAEAEAKAKVQAAPEPKTTEPPKDTK